MTDGTSSSSGLLSTRSGFILLCFLAIIGFLLFTEHRAHVLGFLPYGLLLLCPLLHLFHHGGHGGHGQHGQNRPNADELVRPWEGSQERHDASHAGHRHPGGEP